MKMQNTLAALILIPAFLVAHNSEANLFAKNKAHKLIAAGTPPVSDPEISEAAFDKALQDADARGNRKVATADKITDQALTDSFKNLRNRFVGGPTIQNGKEIEPTLPGIKSAEDLHAFLKDLNDDAYYAKLSPDAQFIAAQMAPLIVFHGFFNRAMELLEPNPITHMASVTGLRTFASSVMVYFPTDQWKVGMEYVTKPSTDMADLISSEELLQVFNENELIPAIVKMKDRLNALSFKDKPIYFDNRFFYGTASFFSDRDQYFRVGEAERLTVLANSYYILSGLESLNAYSLGGLFNTMDQLSKNFGFHSVFFDPEATSSRKRFDVLKDACDYYHLFSLRPNGAAWMNEAYKNLSLAVANNTYAFRELKQYPSDTNSSLNFMDPRTFMSSFPRMGAGLNNMRYIVVGSTKGGHMQSAIVSSEGKTVSLKIFYTNPPATLKSLMPTGFDVSPYSPTPDVVYKGAPRPWHNFLSGRPTAWSTTDYQKIFPEVSNNKDITDTARIMAQAWGGWLIGVPMSALVL